MAGGQAGTDQSTDDQAATRTVARLGAGGTSIEGLTRQLQIDEAAEAKQLAPLQAQRAQAVQAITAARQGAPAEPKYGDIPKAPQFKPEGDPLQLFANPAIFLTVLGSLRTRAPMTAAMNAMAAGLNAAHEGRLDAMKAAREQYKDSVDAVVAQNQIESQRYTASLERYKNNMDALKGSLDAISTEFNDVQVQHLLRQDNIRDVISLIQERNRQAEAMQAHADKIIEMSQAHQDRMMQLQVEKERLSQGKWVPMTVQPFVDAQGKQQPARTVMFNDKTHEVLEANGQPADPSTLGVLSKAGTQAQSGILSPEQTQSAERLAKQVANYMAPPPSLARNNAYAQQVWDMVLKENPDYDVTSYQAKGAVAKAFASGKEAQMVRSNNAVEHHLDLMSELVDALDNNDVGLLNKLGNEVAQRTGRPAPTNFAAARDIVADEVIKAIVANGGTGADRQGAQEKFSLAGSPDQLKGVIDTYKRLFGGQLLALKRQYEQGTGLKNFNDKLDPEARQALAAAERSGTAPQALSGRAASDLSDDQLRQMLGLTPPTP